MGGSETSLAQLLASIRSVEPDWELYLVLGQTGTLADRAQQLGVKVDVVPFPPALARLGDAGRRPLAAVWSLFTSLWSTALYARRLASLIRTIQPAVIHSNGLKMHVLGSWIRPRKTRLIWHMHDYVSTRPLMRRLLRLCRSQCAGAIANSSSVAEDLRAVVPGLKVVPIHNAIDLERFAPNGKTIDLDQISGLAPIAPGTIRVGLPATFARWKGHSVFLRALSLLPGELAVRGYVIGGPIYQTTSSQHSQIELQQEANRLGLAAKVGFTGFLEDPAAAMRSLDIIVHASTQAEPFGMVIIEGMACGKAVIVSQAGGACELFIDGVNALGHDPGDAAALARQIERLACDGVLRRRLGVAARATTEERFRGKRLAKQLLSLYRNVLAETDYHLTNPLTLPAAVSVTDRMPCFADFEHGVRNQVRKQSTPKTNGSSPTDARY
jgi:glycosyltransferase involved in cell wall biosynthesis